MLGWFEWPHWVPTGTGGGKWAHKSHSFDVRPRSRGPQRLAGKPHRGWGPIFLTPPKHHSDALALGNKSGGDNFRCQNHVLRIDFRKYARKKAKNAPNWTFSSIVPRPMPATRPGPSPPSRRHPARPGCRVERPGRPDAPAGRLGGRLSGDAQELIMITKY